MKKLVQALILAAAVLTVVAVVSKLICIPVGGIAARTLVVLSGLLLLFAIALK